MSEIEKISFDSADMSIIYVSVLKFRDACIRARKSVDFIALIDDILKQVKSSCSKELLSSLGVEF